VSKRYSKRVRDEAADVRQMCQSNPWMMLRGRCWDIRGNSKASQDIAVEAFLFCGQVLDRLRKPVGKCYAEAESLLRTGWTP